MNLCLIFGYHAVIGASSFGGVCEYTKHLLTAASDRALAAGSMPLSESQITLLQELFFDISIYVEKSGKTPAINELEAGSINRRAYVRKANEEFSDFIKFISSSSETDKELSDLRTKYSPLKDGGLLSALVKLYDSENFLCVMEKTPLRKNVLNLIHFLRTKFQDVKIGVVCNNWEAEGTYVATAMASRVTGLPVFIPGTCPQEYRESDEVFKSNRFTTNGLFDIVVQSHIEKERKPSPNLLKQAIDGLTELSSTEDSRSLVYVFEGREVNVSMAKEAKGVAKAYHIRSGPNDVYQAVLDALKDLSRHDPRWNNMHAQVMRVIGPLFKSPPAEGWRQAELLNTDGNMLFLPPPIDSKIEVVEGVLIGPIERAILVDLRDRLPQCFPLSENDQLVAEGPSVGTSAGPVLFEKYRTNYYPDAYRITLRTGSFIVRVEPKGGPKAAALSTLTQHTSISKLVQAGISYANGGIPLSQIYRITKSLAATTKVPVEEGLAFISSEVNGLGRDFYVQRYVDSRVLTSTRELVDTSVVRAYSRSRDMPKHSPSPNLFVNAVLDIMVELHAAPIPEDLQEKAAALAKIPDNYLLHLAKEYQALSIKKGGQPPENLKRLGNDLISFLQKERPIPTAHLTTTHGFLSLENFMLAHRSLEGNPEFPFEIVRLSLDGCDVGDPLQDLAALTLITKARLPEGIAGLPIAAKRLFPSEDEMIERYYAKSSAKGSSITSLSVQETKNFIHIYQALHCYRTACLLFAGIRVAKLAPSEEERRLQYIARWSALGLSLISHQNIASKL